MTSLGGLPEEGASKGVPPFVVALDFGGTKIALGLVDRQGSVIDSSVTMRAERSPHEVVAWATDEFRALLDRHDLSVSMISGVGAAVPGYVDRDKQVLEFAPAHGWRKVPFAAMLQETLALPAAIENDVNACALAERWFRTSGERRGYAVDHGLDRDRWCVDFR